MCVMTPLCEFFPRFSVIYWTINFPVANVTRKSPTSYRLLRESRTCRQLRRGQLVTRKLATSPTCPRGSYEELVPVEFGLYCTATWSRLHCNHSVYNMLLIWCAWNKFISLFFKIHRIAQNTCNPAPKIMTSFISYYASEAHGKARIAQLVMFFWVLHNPLLLFVPH